MRRYLPCSPNRLASSRKLSGPMQNGVMRKVRVRRHPVCSKACRKPVSRSGLHTGATAAGLGKAASRQPVCRHRPPDQTLVRRHTPMPKAQTTADKPLTARELAALREASGRPGGWGFFSPKTTARLAERGFFVKQKHPSYGMHWRITAAGRAAAGTGEQP